MSIEEQAKQLKDMIDKAQKIVFFGGAGVSTASGIPDFRSKDGLYNQHDVQFDEFTPEYLLSRTCLSKTPKVFYEFYRQKLDCRNIEPNIVHKKLAELEKTKDITIVTQNIDGLHQKAGSTKVLEIHGSAMRCKCLNCQKEYPGDYIFNSTEEIPRCTNPKCHSKVRPDIVLYEEQLPKEFNLATRIISEADLLIVAGTSLSVWPANTLLSFFESEELVFINKDKTDMEHLVHAKLRIEDDMTKVFALL